MPTVTIRVSEDEKRAIEDEAATIDQSVSEYVRRSLNLRVEHEEVIGGLLSSVEVLLGRVNRLEKIAGLE